MHGVSAGRGAGQRNVRAVDHRGVGGAHAQAGRLRPHWWEVRGDDRHCLLLFSTVFVSSFVLLFENTVIGV